MIPIKSTLLGLILTCATSHILAQANPYISVLPSNSGIVTVGGTNDFLITVGNTLEGSIPVSKLRPVITVPASVTFLPDAQQNGLPTGWTILSNTGSQLRLCNSGDVIPGLTSRDIVLKVQGVTIAPPQTFSGQINFGNGSTCAAGPTVSGNLTADDFATSTIEVIAGTVPLTLLKFSASLTGCTPTLFWQTENEVNSINFEVQRYDDATASWLLEGSVTATGNQSVNRYSYIDNHIAVQNKKILYRLKMNDRDGGFKYSPVLPVEINCSNITASVFPNPVSDGKLYVSITGIENKAEVKLVSTSGQTVLSTSVINGTNFIDVKNISSGIYMIHIKDANGIDKKWKIIVNN
ncbi:MAG: T9SS type A sorting domain-containing protein [Ferruginibacter sp.]